MALYYCKRRTNFADGKEVEKFPPCNRSSIEKISDEDKNKKPNSERLPERKLTGELLPAGRL